MKRKGFTLVELLIVIVVIGILSAMMMLSSTEATTSAKATAIVSNLRNFKTAALAYYTDNMSTADTLTSSDITSVVLPYLKASEAQTVDSHYKVVIDTSDWYATYDIQGTATEKGRIEEKLKKRKDEVGLCEGSAKGTAYNGGPTVGMFIR